MLKKNETRKSYLNIIKLIRSLQKAENKTPCFMTEKRIKCEEMDCPWRKYCLKGLNKDLK